MRGRGIDREYTANPAEYVPSAFNPVYASRKKRNPNILPYALFGAALFGTALYVFGPDEMKQWAFSTWEEISDGFQRLRSVLHDYSG